jgi:hypothetical protein
MRMSRRSSRWGAQSDDVLRAMLDQPGKSLLELIVRKAIRCFWSGLRV